MVTAKANVASLFRNDDYPVVQVSVRSTGTKNFKLDTTNQELVVGPEGDTFRYAWKSKDKSVTMRFAADAATASYGDNIVFGTPAGNVPDQ